MTVEDLINALLECPLDSSVWTVKNYYTGGTYDTDWSHPIVTALADGSIVIYHPLEHNLVESLE